MRGTICEWKDDKGFGFIRPEDGSQNIFFHISHVKTTARRPQRNDLVTFEVTRDSQERLRAKHVVIEGVRSRPSSQTSQRIRTEPRQKDDVGLSVHGCSGYCCGRSALHIFPITTCQHACPIWHRSRHHRLGAHSTENPERHAFFMCTLPKSLPT